MILRERVRKGFVATLATAFMVYHLAAVTIANLSTSTTLRGHLHPWFRPYTSLLGLWQEWDMFTTIPYYAEMRPTLIAAFPGQPQKEFGPMLPGLESAPNNLKITSVFSRVMWSRSAFETNVSQWERAGCLAVARATGVMPRSVQLKLSTQRLNPLAQVRSTGESSHPEEFTTRPALCKP